jgi:hypothetical protein
MCADITSTSARQDDRQALTDLNVEIGRAETDGNRALLETILAPKLAFLRANGAIDDREEFLNKVTRKDPPEERETEVESIAFYGNRAVVSCIVTMASGRYHNIRLFIKHGDWKLLGWANETLPPLKVPTTASQGTAP